MSVPSTPRSAVTPALVQLRDVLFRTNQVDPSDQPDEPFTYVDVSAVDSGALRIVSTKVMLGREAPSRARKRLAAGDTIFATVRPGLRRIALVPADLDGAVASTGYAVLRPNPELLDASYLYFAVSSRWFVEKVARLQRGSSYPAVAESEVLQQTIALPRLHEQRAIAHILSTVQRVKETTESVIATTKELKKSLMRHLFTYGPVPINQVDQVRLKGTEVGPIPEDWDVAVVGDVAEVICGQHLGPQEQGGGPYAYITGPADFTDLVARPSRSARVRKATCQPGDVLLTVKGAGVGKANLAPSSPAVISRQIYAVRPDPARIDDLFLLLALNRHVGELRAGITVTTVPGISRDHVRTLRIPLPSLATQERCRSVIWAVHQELAAAGSEAPVINLLFDSLLSKLLSGRSGL